jgi:oligogalacturonide lyase
LAKAIFYQNERIEYTDAKTGAHLIQLTSYPVPSFCLPYVNTNFTPDSKTLVFLSQREARRDAPWDLFRVEADGSGLTQLTDFDDLSGPVLAPDGKRVYFRRANRLWYVDMDTQHEEEIGHCEGVHGGGIGCISPDGRYYFTTANTRNQLVGLLRFRTDGPETLLLGEWEVSRAPLHACSPGGAGLLMIFHFWDHKEYRLFDYDGNDRGLFSDNYDFAHCTFLGRTDRIQGCALPPDSALLHLGIGEFEPTVIARGPYFWHSASTLDGEWIIADTNWPDQGLQLVHVPTGRFRPLCYPHSSQGHPQWTHPHPQFSPDGNSVLFHSDRTGICQVYLARVPAELKTRTREGKIGVTERRM